MAGWCGARDADGQGCTHGPVHLLHAHQSTGLRATRADELEAMEAPLLARFGFSPIVRQDLVRTEAGGLNPDLGPARRRARANEKVRIHLRLVCFARE